MRRTYKSKKETSRGLEHRDVLLTMDPKSSIFDAFYIQNIKQTKRDMLVGSSMQFAASNKVRKRKYVKRLKEESIIKESCSTSAYLTPDKSLRVNKPADLFDLLLRSSPSESEPKHICNKFTNSRNSSYRRKYRKTATNKKRINPSSSSTDSDKENSTNEVSTETQDISDILCHKLEIEKDEKVDIQHIDESIDIINNLSIFNEKKNNDMISPKCLKSVHISQLQNSPLCSTPFNQKYRGKSIYRFSPITMNLNRSPTIITVPEENENIIDKEEAHMEKLDCSSQQSLHNDSSHYPLEPREINSPILQNTTNSKVLRKKVLLKQSEHYDSNEPIELSSIQTTELEPFLGFSRAPQDFEIEALVDEYREIEKNILSKENAEKDCNKSNSILCDVMEKDLSESKNDTDTSSDDNDISLVSIDNDISLVSIDNDSSYDTCESDQNEIKEDSKDLAEKQLMVVVDRLHDSVLQKYLEKVSNVSLDSNDKLSHYLTKSDDYASIDLNESSNLTLKSQLNLETCKNQNKHIYNIDSDNDKAEEDICVSFVTTRRRIGVTNDSFLLTLDNSITSGSSSDVDKTVLTLNARSSELDIAENNYIQYSHSSSNNAISPKKQNDAVNEPNISTSNRTSENFNVRKLSLKPKKRSISPLQRKKKSEMKSPLQEQRNSVTHRNVTRRSSRVNKETLSPINNNINETQYKQEANFISAMDKSRISICEPKQGIVLQPGKRWERSLSIYRRMTTMADRFDQSLLDEEQLTAKGRKYRQSVISTMEMQDNTGSVHNESSNSRRSTFVSKPSRSTIQIIRDSNVSRASLSSTTILEDTQGFLTEDCDDTIVELSKLSIADSEHEITVLEQFNDTSNRIATARDYLLRRCDQTDVLLFDECYPDTALKNCRKIGEGVYGEVFLWRARDGRARVLKIVPIAGHTKVNGEDQKDYHEIISEVVIAMELSALRTPIADIEKHLDEGKSVETLDLHSVMNATDVFNEVLAVRCVRGSYPSRLLDLWELYDESSGSDNDNPAVLLPHQAYLVLELANAGQDLESYQFVNAEQAYALFKQVAFGLAVAEESFEFEHRDLHWGNVLISPTDQKYATFVLRGRSYRVGRRGVAATLIDYSLSRASLRCGPAAADRAALYNDLAQDESLFDAVGDYQFTVYRLMRERLGNDWKNFEPYTNILWLHYTVDKMITALRYTRTNTKIHRHYISKLKDIKNRILDYRSAVQYVLTDNDL